MASRTTFYQLAVDSRCASTVRIDVGGRQILLDYYVSGELIFSKAVT